MGYGLHPLRFNRRRLAIACVLFLALLALFVLLRRLRLNTTESAPVGLYFILPKSFSPTPPETDTWVAVCLPQRLSRFSRRRGYLASGSCPPGVAPVLKHLAAKPGDRIELSPTGLWVNRQRIPNSTPRSHDSKGRLLPIFPYGSFQVGQDELWLVSPMPKSWDSRYFGPVGTEGLLGVAVPIWTAGPPGGVETAEPLQEQLP